MSILQDPSVQFNDTLLLLSWNPCEIPLPSFNLPLWSPEPTKHSHKHIPKYFAVEEPQEQLRNGKSLFWLMSICTGRLLEFQYLNVQLFGRRAYSFEGGFFAPPEMNGLKNNNKKIELPRDLKNSSFADFCIIAFLGELGLLWRGISFPDFRSTQLFPHDQTAAAATKKTKSLSGNVKELVSFGSPTNIVGPLEYYHLPTFIAWCPAIQTV